MRNTWAICREVWDSSPKGELIPHVARGDITPKPKSQDASWWARGLSASWWGNGSPRQWRVAGLRGRPATLELRHGPDTYGWQQSRIFHNGGNPDGATPRGGRRSSDCKLLSCGNKKVIVLQEEETANSVPAAAVIQRSQALFGFIGRKGCVGGVESWVWNPRA